MGIPTSGTLCLTFSSYTYIICTLPSICPHYNITKNCNIYVFCYEIFKNVTLILQDVFKNVTIRCFMWNNLSICGLLSTFIHTFFKNVDNYVNNYFWMVLGFIFLQVDIIFLVMWIFYFMSKGIMCIFSFVRKK